MTEEQVSYSFGSSGFQPQQDLDDLIFGAMAMNPSGNPVSRVYASRCKPYLTHHYQAAGPAHSGSTVSLIDVWSCMIRAQRPSFSPICRTPRATRKSTIWTLTIWISAWTSLTATWTPTQEPAHQWLR